MNKKIILTVFFIILSLNFVQGKKRVYYLYVDQHDSHQTLIQNLQNNRQNHPVHKINCKVNDCSKYKVSEYPALIFWNGPGTSYKTIYPPNVQGLHEHFNLRDMHPLRAIRNFMQRISLIEAFGVAITVATFLFIVFSFLFKDRTGLQQARKKKNL